MDENKPRRRWLSFGIRDLLWAMVVVAAVLGWWRDRSSLTTSLDGSRDRIAELEQDYKDIDLELRKQRGYLELTIQAFRELHPEH